MIEKFWEREVTEEDILREIDGKYTSADIINIFRSTDDFETIKGMFMH
jgi:hypothetical protein